MVLEYFLACSPSPIFSKIVEIEHFALGRGGGGHLGFKCTEGAGPRVFSDGMGGRREKVFAPSPKPSTLSVPCHFLSAHSEDEEMYCSVALPRLVSICLFTFVCLFVYRS